MVVSAARPARFHPEDVPVGAQVRFVSFWQDRPRIKPRSQHAHTNAASGSSSIQSAINWSEAKPGVNTLPHYQVQRDGTAAKLLPTNRKGIGSTTAASARGTHGNVADWTLVYETQDTGTKVDPAISPFTDAQLEAVAVIFAYESVVAGLDLNGLATVMPHRYPSEWWGEGSSTHTEPFGYPYTTLYPGKTCPGSSKKRQVRELVLPRARQIVKSWLGPVVPPTRPPQEEYVMFVQFVKLPTSDHVFSVWSDGRKTWHADFASFSAAQALAALDNAPDNIVTIDDPAMFRALGFVDGPRPSGTDEWGVPS